MHGFPYYFDFSLILLTFIFYRTRVRSLAMLVTHSLTDQLTDSCLVELMIPTAWWCRNSYWELWKAFLSWFLLHTFTVCTSRSLAMLVTHSLTHSVTFSKLDWCDPCMWRWQLKTCWGCYCCSGWWWDSCWQQFCADLEGEVWSSLKLLFRLWAQGFKVWSRFWSWCSGKILKLKFGHYFATDAWGVVMKLNLGWDSEARFGQDY